MVEDTILIRKESGTDLAGVRNANQKGVLLVIVRLFEEGDDGAAAAFGGLVDGLDDMHSGERIPSGCLVRQYVTNDVEPVGVMAGAERLVGEVRQVPIRRSGDVRRIDRQGSARPA